MKRLEKYSRAMGASYSFQILVCAFLWSHSVALTQPWSKEKFQEDSALTKDSMSN